MTMTMTMTMTRKAVCSHSMHFLLNTDCWLGSATVTTVSID